MESQEPRRDGCRHDRDPTDHEHRDRLRPPRHRWLDGRAVPHRGARLAAARRRDGARVLVAELAPIVFEIPGDIERPRSRGRGVANTVVPIDRSPPAWLKARLPTG